MTAPVAIAPRVLVTGVTGYIGSWIAAALLQLGYRVRGTVRSAAKRAEAQRLVAAAPGAIHTLEIAEADLTSAAGWAEAVHECDYILHVASPFFLRVPADPERELYIPAREGTLHVLRAVAGASPRPKRVVLTSSFAAVGYGHPKDADTSTPFTDETWSNPDGPLLSEYIKSKIYAERAAWDFVRTLPADAAFELCAVNPGTVIGPFIGKSDSGSGELIQTLLSGAYPVVPDIPIPLVDIRDVVRVHIAAMTHSGADGKRFVIMPIPGRLPLVAEILRDELAPFGFPVSSRRAPAWMLWIASCFDSKARFAYAASGAPSHAADNRNVQSVLGLDLRADVAPAVRAMAYNMLAHGAAPDRSRGRVLSAAAASAVAAAASPAAAAAPPTAGSRGAAVAAAEAALRGFGVPEVVAGLPRARSS